ncbi:MAG: MBL fold metallo-hydrolase [Clostridia bacterium]|nr:MBL fold metallo-hydrolase [Clostridia bacterium]
MKNEAIVLSVGRADCNILFIGQGDERRCIIIDAGCFPPVRDTALRDLLLQRQVKTIDLLIITHLHADHLAALHTLEDSFTIQKMILPTASPIIVTPQILSTQPGNKYLLNLAMLNSFRGHCQAQGTQIEDVMRYAGAGAISFGEYRLRCLYPFKGNQQLSVSYALKMCDTACDKDACIAYEKLSRIHANADSSVWLLEKGDQALALFAADAPEQTLMDILTKEPLHPRLVKLPHHGIPGGYFSSTLVRHLAPEVLVVSTDARMKDRVLAPCNAIAASCGVPIHFTFDGSYHWFFE